MRLDVRFRGILYATIAVLFVTGAAWLVADPMRGRANAEAWQTVATYLLRLHGGAAMAMLVVLGALIPFHIRVSWRRGENRATGIVMLAANALLVVTAFGLYYLGSDTVRRWASDVHIVVGLGLPLLLAGHVALGRSIVRAVRRARLDRLMASTQRRVR